MYRTAEALLLYGVDINALCKSYTALMIAVAFESGSVMDLLLAREDLDVNCRNPNGETALWWAAYSGHKQAVNKLLQCKDIWIDCSDTLQEMTPFAAAVANGHAEVSQDLLATGKVKVNAQDKCGRAPVHHAMASGSQRVVALLLFSREVDIHCQDDNQRTPFWYAVRYGNLLAAKLLLMRGADPNIPDIYRITPLNTAILDGPGPMLGLLLGSQGVDVSPPVDPGVLGVACDAQPPICLAVELGNRKTVKMLLCRGADVNAYNSLGYPALHLAVQMTDLAMARLLLSHRAIDVNKRARDKCRFTALHKAASAGTLRMVNQLLMKSGIDINARDIKGRTPLWWATKNNHSVVAKRLLAENDLDINAASVGGSTPLHHAVNRANRMIVYSLLAEDRLDPNTPDKTGLTPLGCAARNGDRNMVDLLLTREDIRINSGGFRSNSPLTLAAAGGHFSVMLRLLRHAHAAKMMVASL
jgi:ankyrin repeat protein